MILPMFLWQRRVFVFFCFLMWEALIVMNLLEGKKYHISVASHRKFSFLPAFKRQENEIKDMSYTKSWFARSWYLFHLSVKHGFCLCLSPLWHTCLSRNILLSRKRTCSILAGVSLWYCFQWSFLCLWYKVATVSSNGVSQLNVISSTQTPGNSLPISHPPKYTHYIVQDQVESFNSTTADEGAKKNKPKQ